MPAIECTDEIVIDAAPAVIFDVIADYPNWSRWNPPYSCEFIGPGGMREGAKVQHQYGRKPFVLSRFVRTVDAIHPGERLEESYVEGDLIGNGVWEFKSEGESTKVSYYCNVRSNTAMTHMSFLLMGRQAHSGVFKTLLKRLKAHCESL